MREKRKRRVLWNPELKKNRKNIFANIFGVCFIWFLIFIFTFYMDGETGMIFIYFTLFATVFSYLSAYLSRNKIKISAECQEYVRKGGELSVKINIEKTSRFPFAFVDIYIFSSETLGNEEQHYRMSMIFEKNYSFEYKVKGTIGGNGKTGIKAVYSSGFFGFVSYNTEIPVIQKNIGIIPEIPEINSSNRLFRAVNDIVVTSDDEEIDSPLAFSANSMAGYEHREYVQGDSLKRINWKLSSKRNKLMVRLDEASASVQPIIVADLFTEGEDKLKNAVNNEKTICLISAMLSLFVKQGISCKVFLKTENNEPLLFQADSEESINNILMNMIITPSENLTPFDESIFYAENACSYLIFSVKPNFDLMNSEFAVSNKESVYFVVSDTEVKNQSRSKMWCLNSDNNFEQV